MKRILLTLVTVSIAIMLIATFSITGCKTTTAETTAAETTTAETTAAETTVAETSAEKPMKEWEFVIVPKSAGDSWYNDAVEGFLAAGKELGIGVRVEAPAEYGGEFQANIIDNLVAQGVTGIAIAVVDKEKLLPAIDRAVEAGVAIIAFDAGSSESKQIMEIGTDNFAAGAMQGELFVKLAAGGEEKFVITTPDLTSENLKQRVDGIRSTTSDVHDNLVEATTEQSYKGSDMNVAVELANNILNTYPELTANLDTAIYGTVGMMAAMKEQGIAPGKLKMISWTNFPEVIQGLKEGYLTASMRQNPYLMGYLSVFGLKYYIEGKKPTQKHFDTGIGVLTNENAATYETETNRAKVPAALEEFNKIW